MHYDALHYDEFKYLTRKYKYKYLTLKYKYKYLTFKYKYKYFKSVLEYRSSTSTSTKYYKSADRRFRVSQE